MSQCKSFSDCSFCLEANCFWVELEGGKTWCITSKFPFLDDKDIVVLLDNGTKSLCPSLPFTTPPPTVPSAIIRNEYNEGKILLLYIISCIYINNRYSPILSLFYDTILILLNRTGDGNALWHLPHSFCFHIWVFHAQAVERMETTKSQRSTSLL